MEALVLEQWVPGSPAAVYAMWTEPELMRRWLFVSERGQLTSVVSDAVLGGSFSILEHIDGEQVDHLGTFTRVEPPHRLGFSLVVPQHFAETTQIYLDFAADAGGSRVDFVQSG